MSDMHRVSFVDPRRHREKLFGGPHFISGWMLSDGSRFFSEDRSIMWLREAMETCWDEGLNYEGHRL